MKIKHIGTKTKLPAIRKELDCDAALCSMKHNILLLHQDTVQLQKYLKYRLRSQSIGMYCPQFIRTPTKCGVHDVSNLVLVASLYIHVLTPASILFLLIFLVQETCMTHCSPKIRHQFYQPTRSSCSYSNAKYSKYLFIHVVISNIILESRVKL